MRPLQLTAFTSTSAIGCGNAASLAALRSAQSGLQLCDFANAGLQTWIGRVPGLEEQPLEGAFAAFDCRNNRLARLALEQDGFMAAVAVARRRYGADRVGVFLGTSTSGIRQTEEAYAAMGVGSAELPAWFDYRHTHNIFSLADFTRQWLGLAGPAQVISTACSSSAKVFASAWRHMAADLCDAAVVGGADSLCLMSLYGFNALQLLANQPCRPADVAREGISIGEAAGFALVEWEAGDRGAVRLSGYGESSDAYHMSSPHPEGLGATLAMQHALDRAGLSPPDVDYVNLHGTATLANDVAEDRALLKVFGGQVLCSSTKGWTGHTLGAAGIVEAVLCCLCLEHGLVPKSLNTCQVDPVIQVPPTLENRDLPIRRVLTNAFGFGGSNCSLVLERHA